MNAATAIRAVAACRPGRGLAASLGTAALAFAAGGVVLAVSGADPITTYGAILEGAGLTWLLPWTSPADRALAAQNLQGTLLLTAPLILTGLAVAYAFRAGLFNIGGQGQYLVGAIAAVWAGTALDRVPGPLHATLAIGAAMLAGATWAGLAGLLRALAGASEVITTIMLNYVAIWLGVWLFGLAGPLQGRQPSLPVSDDVAPGARLPVFWGEQGYQGLHIGFVLALAAAVLYWAALQRTPGGYETRAVGLNPNAAEYAGISLARKYIRVMLACGLFAGLAGAVDVLGWQYRLATADVQGSAIGFLGIAVALLGRNRAAGVVAAALLFGVLLTGTSVRNLDPAVFDPDLALGLTLLIQGLIVLFISSPVLLRRFPSTPRLRPQRPAADNGRSTTSAP